MTVRSRRLSEGGPQPVNTASTANSIWRGLSRNTFRQHAVALRRAAEIAGDEQVHSSTEWQSRCISSTDLLPFHVEQRLADDFAFVAAAEDNLRAVSAIALEQYIEPCKLVVRLAANEYIPQGVLEMFDHIFELLGRSAQSRKFPREECARALFDYIMVVNQDRVWSRLQPAPQEIPVGLAGKTHEPLHQEILALCDALERQPSNICRGSPLVLEQLKALQKTIQNVNKYSRKSEEVLALLKLVVLDSHKVGTSQGANSLEEYVCDYDFVAQDARFLLCIRQIDKIGRYWGLCKSTTEDSRKYSDLFGNIELHPLCPYKPTTSLITAGRAKRAHLHVHAEMQILAFYGLKSSAKLPKPRVIGVSRAACYLCNLFVQSHEQFFITKTHGWLFDQWNFPDLAETDSPQQTSYRRTIAKMDRGIQSALAKELRNHAKRQKPMGSRLALPLPLLHSPVPSTILSNVPEEGELEATLPISRSTTHVPEMNGAENPWHSSLPVTSATQQDSTQSPIITPSLPSSSRSSNRTATPRSTCAVEPVLSSSSAAPWEYPFQRTISATSPFHGRIGKTSINFEIEDPAQCNVSLSLIEDGGVSQSGITVDLNSMEEGDLREFDRRDHEDKVALNLRQSNGQSIHVLLQWL